MKTIQNIFVLAVAAVALILGSGCAAASHQTHTDWSIPGYFRGTENVGERGSYNHKSLRADTCGNLRTVAQDVGEYEWQAILPVNRNLYTGSEYVNYTGPSTRGSVIGGGTSVYIGNSTPVYGGNTTPVYGGYSTSPYGGYSTSPYRGY